MRKNILYFLFACCLLACNKPSTTPIPVAPTPQSADTPLYSLTNNTTIAINLVWYSNLADYATGTNPFLTYRLAPGQTYTRRFTTAQLQQTYYSDWYSDDYAYARWNNNGYTYTKEFAPEPINLSGLEKGALKATFEQSAFDSFFHTDLKQRFLKGNGTETRWKVVDIFKQHINQSEGTEPVSIWANSTPAMRSTQLVVRKDLTATLSNDTATTQLTFQTSPGIYEQFLGPHLAFAVTPSMGQLYATGKIIWQQPMGQDTIMLFADSYFTWERKYTCYLLKRQ